MERPSGESSGLSTRGGSEGQVERPDKGLEYDRVKRMGIYVVCPILKYLYLVLAAKRVALLGCTSN